MQKKTTAPQTDGANESTALIRPNRMAPIGSEVKELKERRASSAQKTHGRVSSVPEITRSLGERVVELTDEEAVAVSALGAGIESVETGDVAAKQTSGLKAKPCSAALSTPTKKKTALKDQAENERNSEKSFRRLSGVSMKEFSESKVTKAAQKNVSGASDGG